MPISSGDKHREAWARWVGKPPGLSPELASKFTLCLHGGKTVRDMTTADTADYICSLSRFNAHCDLHPDWGTEARRLSLENSNKKKVDGNWNRAKTHCARGHDLAVHGKLTIQKAGWKWRRCTLCTAEYQKASGTIRPDAVEKVKEHLRSGGKIADILKSIMRPPVYNLLRLRDPSINELVEATRPLREANRVRVSYGGPGSRGGVSHLPGARQSRPSYQRRMSGLYTLREPTLTGIIAGQADPILTAATNAVSNRLPYDVRQEAIALTVMDYLEHRIDFDGIPVAAKKHSGRLYNSEKYRASLDAPRWRDSATPWIETVSEADGIWA